jgi:hypothetical protein
VAFAQWVHLNVRVKVSKQSIHEGTSAVLTDVKVHQTSLSLSTPVSVSGDLERAESVGFLSDLALGLLKHEGTASVPISHNLEVWESSLTLRSRDSVPEQEPNDNVTSSS